MAFSLKSSSILPSLRALAISFATRVSEEDEESLEPEVGLDEPDPEPDPDPEGILSDLRMLFSMVARSGVVKREEEGKKTKGLWREEGKIEEGRKFVLFSFFFFLFSFFFFLFSWRKNK